MQPAAGSWSSAPLAVWVALLWSVFGEPSNAGQRNFAAPFEAYLGKWYETVQDLRANGWEFMPKWTLVMLVSLTVQFLVILLRPQWSSLWWRIGASYAVLLIFLGEAVWEGYPGAAARVVVPLTLAFNVVVPRGRWWWPVLLLGNLSALSAVDQLRPPGHESYPLEGPRNVWMAPAHQSIEVAFGDGISRAVPLRILAMEPRLGRDRHSQSARRARGDRVGFRSAGVR